MSDGWKFKQVNNDLFGKINYGHFYQLIPIGYHSAENQPEYLCVVSKGYPDSDAFKQDQEPITERAQLLQKKAMRMLQNNIPFSFSILLRGGGSGWLIFCPRNHLFTRKFTSIIFIFEFLLLRVKVEKSDTNLKWAFLLKNFSTLGTLIFRRQSAKYTSSFVYLSFLVFSGLLCVIKRNVTQTIRLSGDSRSHQLQKRQVTPFGMEIYSSHWLLIS